MTATETMKPTSVAETLRAARALIEDPERWTQGGLARDEEGYWVPPTEDRAVKWCMLGAIRRVDGPFETEAIDTLASTVRGRYIPDFNDAGRRRHAEVLAKFDKAIAMAEAVAAYSAEATS